MKATFLRFLSGVAIAVRAVLRNKLRAVRADEEPIRTHRGLGYSIAVR